jgi:hypothetical protein
VGANTVLPWVTTREPSPRWRRWFAWTLRSLDAVTEDNIIASWLLRVRPNVWSLTREPTLVDRTRWPGRTPSMPPASGVRQASLPRSAPVCRSPPVRPFALGAGHPGFAFGRPTSQVVPCEAIVGRWRIDRAW